MPGREKQSPGGLMLHEQLLQTTGVPQDIEDGRSCHDTLKEQAQWPQLEIHESGVARFSCRVRRKRGDMHGLPGNARQNTRIKCEHTNTTLLPTNAASWSSF